MRIVRSKAYGAFRATILVVPFALLVACDNAEDRAERHFQSALELLQAGDVERAVVEFRNVFKLNGEHRDARATYAALRRSQGDYVESVGQYLRLVEQYPEDYEANVAIAEMYAEIGRWEELDRFTTTLSTTYPDDAVSQALNLVRVYNQAVLDRDPITAEDAAQQAIVMRQTLPEYELIRQVIADDFIRKGDFENALAELDAILEIDPDKPAIYAVRLSVLGALGDGLAIEEQLRDNIKRFPDDPSYGVALVRYFISQKQLDAAEAFLREQIAEQPEQLSHKLTLLRFMTELRGSLDALEEIDLMIAQGEDDPSLLQLRAGLIFDMGEVDAAKADLEDLAERLGLTEEGLRVRVSLAKLREQTGDRDGAQVLVDEVLSANSSNVEALKIRANWLIQNDDTGNAIVSLRSALEQKPNDPDIYFMLALAHDREGNTELVGEMLALASEVSKRAPVHTARYARHLITNGIYGPAESALLEALRVAPANIELLRELGYTYLGLREWGRLEQVIATLRNFDDETAQSTANDLQTRLLVARQRIEEALDFLSDLARRGEAGFAADVAIVSAQLDRGNPERAKVYLNERLESAPNDPGLTFLMAATETALGNLDVAEQLYRRNIDGDASEIRSWLGLFRLLQENGREDEARAIAEEGLSANPESGTLLWIKASLLEHDGDIAGAVDIYQKLYDQDSNNLIIANNLASLMVDLSQDPETVTEAFKIARRLRASAVPPYQDTYGWIATLRGDYVEALSALEPAAAALSDDPAVQYHLAKAYLGHEDFAKAYAKFALVLDLVEDGDTRAFVTEARLELERLAVMPEVAGSQ